MNKRGLKNDGTPDLRGSKKIHGLTHHLLYYVWGGIKARCYNKSHFAYKYYGGRGIIMCDEWKNNFMAFYDWAIANGWKKGLSVERENNDKIYCPSNCKLIPKSDQPKNRKSNHAITYNGETKNLTEWCKTLKLKYMLVLQRMKTLGWSFERSIATPSIRKSKSA